MKKVVLIRHAKAELSSSTASDFDRPLAARGHRDAQKLSDKLLESGLKPDLIISSPALRAQSTAKIFADKFSYNEKQILLDIEVYKNGYKAILDNLLKLEPLSNTINTVFIFGHNPDISAVLLYLSGERGIHLTTSSVACLSFPINSWTEVENTNGVLDFLLSPKQFFDDIGFD